MEVDHLPYVKDVVLKGDVIDKGTTEYCIRICTSGIISKINK